MDIHSAVKLLKDGGILAYPTETLYGLGVDASNEEAIAKIFAIKKRDLGKPVSILIGSDKELKRWAKNIGSREKKLIKKFWPGPLTVVFKARRQVSALLTAGSGKIGIRISPELIARQLSKALATGLTATSANKSGANSTCSPTEVRSQLGKNFPIVGNKKLKASKGSTIIDVTGKEIKLIREGEIGFEVINNFLNI